MSTNYWWKMNDEGSSPSSSFVVVLFRWSSSTIRKPNLVLEATRHAVQVKMWSLLLFIYQSEMHLLFFYSTLFSARARPIFIIVQLNYYSVSKHSPSTLINIAHLTNKKAIYSLHFVHLFVCFFCRNLIARCIYLFVTHTNQIVICAFNNNTWR